MDLYKERDKDDKSFVLMHCWNKLKNESKWKSKVKELAEQKDAADKKSKNAKNATPKCRYTRGGNGGCTYQISLELGVACGRRWQHTSARALCCALCCARPPVSHAVFGRGSRTDGGGHWLASKVQQRDDVIWGENLGFHTSTVYIRHIWAWVRILVFCYFDLFSQKL